MDLINVSDIVDPVNTECYNRFLEALEYKKAGDLNVAAKLLMQSCRPPSIYKGHYAELFKIFRLINKTSLKNNEYDQVIERVLLMITLDDEMINEMLRYWGDVQNRILPADYFDKSRNLKITDVKALKTAAIELNQHEHILKADSILSKRFNA